MLVWLDLWRSETVEGHKQQAKHPETNMRSLDVIILAAGKGNRMNSDLPKPLHAVKGKTSLRRLLESVAWIGREPIIVVGHQREKIMEALGFGRTYVVQEKQQGTGHALRAAKDALKDWPLAENIMVLPGDHPLISEKTLRNLWNVHEENNAVLTMGTVTAPDFIGDHELFSHYGRVLRDERGRVRGVIEEKDASEEEKRIKEVNITNYCFKTGWLWENIDALTSNNKSHEFYLTDMVQIAASQGIPIYSYALPDITEGMGFNTPEQLETLRRLAGL